MDLVLGTAQLTRPYGIFVDSRGPELAPATESLIKTAQEVGFRGIDTAPVYGDAERSIGLAETALSLHTKFDPSLDEEDSLRRSLHRLRRDSLEVVYFHKPLTSQDLAKRVPELRKRLSLEVVTHLGVSVYELEECLMAIDCEAVTAVQVPTNVFDRRFSPDLFRDFIARGGRVFVRSIFLQGLLLSAPDRIPPALGKLTPYLRSFWEACRIAEVSPLSAAMWFTHESLPFGSLIVGTRSVVELKEIADASRAGISLEFREVLADLAQPPWDMVDPRKW